MKTYLTVWFSSEGGEPSVVAQKLQSLGFKPVKGQYDHVYDWKKDATLDDVLQLLNHVHQTLKGLNVLYKIETIWHIEAVFYLRAYRLDALVCSDSDRTTKRQNNFTS